jgi:hypothetical protein
MSWDESLGGVGGRYVASDVLLHSLGFALPPNVVSRERTKVLSVMRQLLAAALGAERLPLLKARFQPVFMRKIMVDEWRICRSMM